jgi:hypothetical protein
MQVASSEEQVTRAGDEGEAPEEKAQPSTIEPLNPGARVIHLLPALPKAWPDGHVTGMRVRGGFEVDIAWKDGRLTQAVLKNISNPEGRCTVRYGDITRIMKIPVGAQASFLSNGAVNNTMKKMERD